MSFLLASEAGFIIKPDLEGIIQILPNSTLQGAKPIQLSVLHLLSFTLLHSDGLCLSLLGDASRS